MLKILIIGSNSNIGKEVSKFLLKKKDIIKIYGVDIQKKSEIKSKKIYYKKIDLSKKNTNLLNLKKKIDIALIFSFNLNYKDKNKYKYFYQGKNIINNSIKLINLNKISKVIYFSSLAVYGNQNKIFTERTQVNPNTNYGKLKVKSEKILSNASKKNYLYLIFRLSQIYGKEIKSSWVNKFFEYSKNKKYIKIYGDGTQKRDLLHIKDLNNLIYKSLFFSSSNIFNVCSQQSLSLNQVVKQLKAKFYYCDYPNAKLEVKNIISKNKKVKKYFNWKAKIKFNTSALKLN